MVKCLGSTYADESKNSYIIDTFTYIKDVHKKKDRHNSKNRFVNTCSLGGTVKIGISWID